MAINITKIIIKNLQGNAATQTTCGKLITLHVTRKSCTGQVLPSAKYRRTRL